MQHGYFEDNKREFIITDLKPRRTWYNYLWNEKMVCVCDQFGFGNSWSMLEGSRRGIEAGERNIYIKDLDSGEYYSANRNYFDLPFEKHETHVGLGYQTIVSEYKGVRVEFTVTTPINDTITLFKVKVKNTSAQKKRLGVYFQIIPTPALTGHTSYGRTCATDDKTGLVYTHKGFNVKSAYTTLYVGSEQAFDSYEMGYKQFRGEYNGYYNPVGLQKERLSSKGTTFESEHVAVMQYDKEFAVGEEFENTFFATWVKDETDITGLRATYLGTGNFNKILEEQNQLNQSYLDVFTMQTPDKYLNSQTNIWLKRQVSLGKTWGRLYGKGFRDVMQDITAFVSFEPELARTRILYALRYQYEDGNPIRMFEPNFHYPYNDGGVWIPSAVLSYLNETGDNSILDEKVTYLKGDSYGHVSFADAFVEEPYTPGERVDSVLEHIQSAVDYLLQCRGEHGLVLFRGGDWNDSLNNVGVLNKGESVWLSIATVKAINEWKEILAIVGGREEEINAYEVKKQELIACIQAHGFKDGQYIYGINDYGEIVGGSDRIFLNPQTWAVLANLTDRNCLEEIMAKVESRLSCDYGYVQCSPSYTKGDDHIGRVSYFEPGLVENGAVYNHGVAFKIVADCMLGKGDTAYKTLKAISCDNPKNPDSGVEPYAVSNMYIGPENECMAGYAPMSWITGTAGWLYRSVTEYICGIKPSPNGLLVKPCMPSSWDNVTVVRKFRGETYEIVYHKSTCNALICDGKAVDILPLTGKGSVHKVICQYT